MKAQATSDRCALCQYDTVYLGGNEQDLATLGINREKREECQWYMTLEYLNSVNSVCRHLDWIAVDDEYDLIRRLTLYVALWYLVDFLSLTALDIPSPAATAANRTVKHHQQQSPHVSPFAVTGTPISASSSGGLYLLATAGATPGGILLTGTAST